MCLEQDLLELSRFTYCSLKKLECCQSNFRVSLQERKPWKKALKTNIYVLLCYPQENQVSWATQFSIRNWIYP